MNCPTCGHADHRVVYARPKDGTVRRRRECTQCRYRWFTIEADEAVYERAADIARQLRKLHDAIGDRE